MDNLFRTIGRFWFPVLCIITGIALLSASFGKVTPQPSEVVLGSACILFVGIVALLYLLDVIKRPIQIALLFIFLGMSVYLFMQNTNSINSEIAYRETAAIKKSETIQALKDIRAAQQAYYSVNRRYTQDANELASFVENGTVPKIKKIGAIADSIGTEANARELGLIIKMPAGMTDAEIVAQGLIVRDTIQMSVMEDKFTNDNAMKSRKHPFSIENIRKAPSSDKPWEMKAAVKDMGGVSTAVLEVADPEPFAGEALKIGSMEEAHLNGNWKED